jgi:hypothetical protein
MPSASKGLFAGIEAMGKEVKEENNKTVNSYSTQPTAKPTESTEKRSYMLLKSTVKKLKELRLFIYEDDNMTYSDIVDKAINLLYEKEKKKA